MSNISGAGTIYVASKKQPRGMRSVRSYSPKSESWITEDQTPTPIPRLFPHLKNKEIRVKTDEEEEGKEEEEEEVEEEEEDKYDHNLSRAQVLAHLSHWKKEQPKAENEG
ncbi:uncharacterized protein ACOB8E_000361 isoform 1-T1 [Sarcophilus harrisii]